MFKMQIDFHHATTYVLARMAGFSHEEADIIAYSAQYVDDCTNGGLLKFKNGPMYYRVPSAHTMGDLKHHMDTQENYLVWSVFHFLPGNEGKMAHEPTSGDFYKKIVCRPDSDVAHRMIDECIKYKDEIYALHRLGIAMHIYADTYAHKGFAGIVHEINGVKNITLENEEEGMFDDIASGFLSMTFKMGHGAVLTNPDKPYLKWSYTDSNGELISRDNTEDFMDACGRLFGELVRFQVARNPDFIPATIHTERDFATIRKNFENFRENEGKDRHERWLESIRNVDFSFGGQELKYIAKGRGSWKYEALGEHVEDDEDGAHEYIFADKFMNSNYKRFHDALQEHRLTILHDILPEYGICLA